MREACTGLIYELAKKDPKVMALTADSRNGFYERISREMPNQYIDYGIAEQNMIASAAGLAEEGRIPFVFAASNFLAMRGFEFIRNDVCLGNKNVKLIGIFSGLTRPAWGSTHQGTEELALMRCLPNIEVISPCSPIEAREATRYAYEKKGPIYLRLESSGEAEHFDEKYVFRPGKGRIIKSGTDITIITMGEIVNQALSAAEKLQGDGISAQVVNFSMIKELDTEMIERCVDETGAIVTLEEHSKYGGLGSAVAEFLAEKGCGIPFKMIGLDGCAKGYGKRDFLRTANGIGLDDTIDVVKKLLERKDRK